MVASIISQLFFDSFQYQRNFAFGLTRGKWCSPLRRGRGCRRWGVGAHSWQAVGRPTGVRAAILGAAPPAAVAVAVALESLGLAPGAVAS